MSQTRPQKGEANQPKPLTPTPSQTALVLQGGGSLGAYEVGVVKGIIDKSVALDKNNDSRLFDIIAGSSVGAINGAILVREFVSNGSWTKAIQNLEKFWNGIVSIPIVDSIPFFSQWWNYWSGFKRGNLAESEAARRYFASLQFWLMGVPDLVNSRTEYDDRFIFRPINFLQRLDWSPLANKLEQYTLEDGSKLFPLKTIPGKEPRLLTTAIDAQSGAGLIFDSYSDKASYSMKVGGKQETVTIQYPGGLQLEHILASAAVPANTNFVTLNDKELVPRRYWDGSFASNTPLRGLLQSHRDWYLDANILPPNLENVYIVGLWPRSIKELPVPPDNNFVWNRMWDLLFDDKTDYVEKNAELVTDYLDIIEKLRQMAEKDGHRDEIEKFLESKAVSKHRDGTHRKKADLLKGRFRVNKITRIEIAPFENASGLKIFDFSQNTISQLIADGRNAVSAIPISH
jgi:NTE family protein